MGEVTDRRLVLAEAGRNNINLQRLVLAALVIVSHAYDLAEEAAPLRLFSQGAVSLGGFAVHAFFVLSGFLIAQSWSHDQRVIPFLVRRVLRIFPGYWFCLVVTVLCFGPILTWLGGGTLDDYGRQVPGAFEYAWRNAFLEVRQSSIGALVGAQPFGSLLNAPLWTLRWEFLCYLGVVGLGLVGVVQKRSVWLVALLVAFYANYHLDPTHARFFGKLYVAPLATPLPVFFLAGMVWWSWGGERIHRSVVFAVLLVSVGSVRMGWYHFVMPFTLPVLLLTLATSFELPSALKKRDYSYGLYVFGFLVQRVLWQLGATKLGAGAYALVSIVATLPIAAISWHLVESPALGLKGRATRWLLFEKRGVPTSEAERVN